MKRCLNLLILLISTAEALVEFHVETACGESHVVMVCSLHDPLGWNLQ